MQYIQGNNRNQAVLFPKCLDELVDQDNEVRIIDLFVDSIKLDDYKFIIKHNTEGRPAYDPKDLLKNEFKKFLEGLILICFFIFHPHQSKSLNIRHLNFNTIYLHSKIKVA